MEKSYAGLTMAEYFAGIGLVRMGLEPCGWQVVFANDFEPKKYAMYQTFFPDAPAHYAVGDIFDLEPAALPPSLLATCSFPCVDLSLAGNMGGIQGRHSSAFWGFIRVLKGQGAAAPPLIMVENVPGWLYSNAGADFRLTVQALNELGYACDVFTLDALRFTPQSRLRVFLIGAKAHTADGVDLLLQRPASLMPDALRKSLWQNLDLRWFYNDLPASPPALRAGGLAEIVEEMGEDDRRWWTEAKVEHHLAMMDDAHRQRVDALMQGEQCTYRAFFRRRRQAGTRAEVRNDDLAGCLRTAVGGSGKQFLIRAGKGGVRMRTMTPREYARLQGVPDAYPITAEGVQALTGFGDAVCAPAIAWIGRHALNPLAGRFLERMEKAA